MKSSTAELNCSDSMKTWNPASAPPSLGSLFNSAGGGGAGDGARDRERERGDGVKGTWSIRASDSDTARKRPRKDFEGDAGRDDGGLGLVGDGWASMVPPDSAARITKK